VRKSVVGILSIGHLRFQFVLTVRYLSISLSEIPALLGTNLSSTVESSKSRYERVDLIRKMKGEDKKLKDEEFIA